MDRKDITTNLKEAYIPENETEMSRRYLMMAQKWIPIGLSYFNDWPVRPNCGHFLGGCWWYGIETSCPVEALAIISTSPEYDENIAGVSKEEIRKIAIKGIRYLCFTHDTGPKDCIRFSKYFGVPNLQNTKWGERGKGFFRESVCGYTISKMVTAAIILRPLIDDETWMMITNICMDYMERFGDIQPRNGIYTNTQMEENAWTSLGLASCYLFMSRHENAVKWEENSKRWMFSTCSSPQDMLNYIEIENSITASQLTLWKTESIPIFTTLPDYMAENHGIVHPSYTAVGVTSTGHLGVLYRLFGRKEPKHAYWNRQRIYNNIKLLTDFTGAPHAIQGMDWPYLYNLGLPDLAIEYVLHACAYLYLKDPDAGYFERISLEYAEKIQEGNNGRLVNADIAEKCREYETPFVVRERTISCIAKPYIMHRLMDSEAPEPTPDDVMSDKLNGVKVFPHSGFVFHKHSRGQTSFSWRNTIMALQLTREGIHTIAPSQGTLLANIIVKDKPQSQKLIDISVNKKDNGFAATMINDLAQESIRQKVLFASLPNGKALCNETLTSLENCTVERVEQGCLEIMNENFPKIEGNCNGYRTLYYPGGQERFNGFISTTPDDDISFELNDSGWVNIDNRMGIVFKGGGRTIYINRHYFKGRHYPKEFRDRHYFKEYGCKEFRAVADSLFLSLQVKKNKYKQGELVGELRFLLCPEQSHNETPNQRLIKAESDDEADCLITDEYMCAGNFGLKQRLCSFKVECNESVPIYNTGTAKINGRRVEYLLSLESGEAVCLREIICIKTEGAVKVESTVEGSTYITNETNAKVKVTIISNSDENIFNIESGKVITLQHNIDAQC